MNHEELKSYLRGASFVTTTPFNEDGLNVNYEEVARNTEAIIEAGGRTIIPGGNTGEYHSLTDEERLRLIETTVDVVNDGIVIAGIGGSTKEAMEQIRAYEEAGVDGVMVHDPDHTFMHRNGLEKYYRRLAESTNLGIVMYKRGSTLTPSTITKLSTIDNIVGLKFAVNDVNAFSAIVRDVPGDIVFTTGLAERYAPAFALEGAEGFTTGIGAFAPTVSLALQDSLEHKHWKRALKIRDLTRPYEDLREEAGSENDFNSANNVPAIKYGLELAGLYGGPVREPLVELSNDDKRRAEKYYEKLTEADITYPI